MPLKIVTFQHFFRYLCRIDWRSYTQFEWVLLNGARAQILVAINHKIFFPFLPMSWKVKRFRFKITLFVLLALFLLILIRIACDNLIGRVKCSKSGIQPMAVNWNNENSRSLFLNGSKSILSQECLDIYWSIKSPSIWQKSHITLRLS